MGCALRDSADSVGDAESFCEAVQPSVERPEQSVLRHQGRGQQHQIDEAAAQTVETMAFDEGHQFV